ncbi:probable helicase with zinc finger domain isoform X2 [Anabrus simplex]|uniref:probable helicase with zinc finger domain isoform X2 n=1 Tax=Anabrus simplex TaxID=316456 RepID=UPI0035A3C405
MNDTEAQAHELLRRKEWCRAIELFDQLLAPGLNKGVPKEKLVGFLLGRSECCLELGRHEAVVSDCRRVIKLLADADTGNNNGARARRRLVHALFSLRRFAEAEAAAREWLASGNGAASQPEAMKMLERVRIVLQMANGQKSSGHRGVTSQQRLDEELLALDSRLESWTALGLPERSRRNRKHPVELIDDSNESEVLPENILPNSMMQLRRKHPVELVNSIDINTVLRQNNFQQSVDHVTMGIEDIQLDSRTDDEKPLVPENVNNPVCSYCSVSFSDRLELRAHCQSESHQTMIMSDEGRDWKWRPPPRGLTSDAYSLCESWADGGGSCRYGAQCVEAHGPEELAEWSERFEYRRMKLQRACEKELFGKSYTEQLLERWVQAPSPEKVMREKLSGVEEICTDDLMTTVSSKVSQREWSFTLRTHHPLRAVALLQDAHRNHFFLKYVSSGDPSRKIMCEWKPSNDQEWSVPPVPALEERSVGDSSEDTFPLLEHRVKVAFATDIYGTFRQSVVFDFGGEPVLVRHLCVDVVPVTDADRMKEIRKELVLSTAERWDTANSEIVVFSSPVTPLVTTPAAVALDSERERDLLSAYPSPRADTFVLTQSTVTEKKLTRNNYRARMHELLCVEEMARYEQVARYNLTAKLHLADCYLLAPSGMSTSTAKYAHLGELFALMNLGKDISEDTSAGRLILNNCTTVLLAPSPVAGKQDPGALKLKQRQVDGENEVGTSKRIVYEALIEDKGKNMIYLRLSAAAVRALNLKPDTDFLAEVQFQLNRIPYCEWHYAIDKIADFRVIFPETYLEPSIPWTPQRQWSDILDSRLNLKQKEAVVAITTPVSCPLPPILIIGPFGTGKTYTLAQAIKQLLIQPDTRVLVCTHSNSAADLYIKDYLHPYVEAGNEHACPLRIYYHKRWVATVNQVVQKYCLIEMNGGIKSFRVPTLEDIMKHRVIVVTLSISMYLSTLGLQKGHFSHILLDEAAQAMECEAIMPLALASDDTRIVLAGDHMQLSPELFSQFAKERNLHVSLLERLYDHYPATFPCKILLCENYRAHEAIIQFTSELFYDQKLISSGKQPRHEKFYPLTFFTTRGEDVQDLNSTAFYNNSEVYEVVERVCELRKKWPVAWGKMDDQSIGIMTPYADQVFRIRSELRKRRMGGISVERVLNVQGKQFRAIFLSTVRTRRTCHSGTKSSIGGDEMDYGFLSNSKLLNTAITRAQSLVAVVGDPVALCSIGRCRKVWERFIEICNQNKSLFGITWSYLRSQLDGVELKKTYVLNPLAPEFIPRQHQGEPYIRLPSLLGPYAGPGLIPPLGTTGPALRFPPAPQPPIPPYLPPHLYYPVYYYPPQPPPPQPSNPNFFPLRPPGPPGVLGPAPPLIYPPSTGPVPWGINYPLVSPPGSSGIVPALAAGRNTPIEWKKKPQQPPIGSDPRREEHRIPPGVQTHVRSPGGMKPAVFMPLPQRPSPASPTDNSADSYVPGGVLSPPSFLQPNLPVGDPVPFGMQNHGMKQNAAEHLGARRGLSIPQDKADQIQFLHNVHFPERHLAATLAKGQQLPAELNSLLPPSISLAEMFESQHRQMEWYNHLLETQGTDAATKFMDLMIMGSASGPRKQSPPPPNIQDCFPPPADMVRTLEDLFNDKNSHVPSAEQMPQVNHLQLLPSGDLPISDGSSWFAGNEKPVDLSGLSNMNPNKPLLLRDIETSVLLAGGGPMNQGPDTSWPPQHQSVPLYRRQAQQITGPPPQDSMALPPVHQLLDGVVDKSAGGSSGAFAGYARAAVSIGLQQREPPTAPQLPMYQAPPLQHHMNSFSHHQIHHHQHQQQIISQHISTEFSKVNGQSDELNEETQRSSGTTYASVLRSQKPSSSTSPVGQDGEKNNVGDPFAVLRALGAKGTQGTSGLYHYFS